MIVLRLLVTYIDIIIIIMGPGLTRINSSVLDDPITLQGVKNDLKDMLDQIPQSWDAHTRLEYKKIHIYLSSQILTSNRRMNLTLKYNQF